MTTDRRKWGVVTGFVVWFFIIAIVAQYASGQNPPTITIDNFRIGGLNTNTNEFSPEYRGFLEFTNWDIKKNGLYVRDGILNVSDSLDNIWLDGTANTTQISMQLVSILTPDYNPNIVFWRLNVNPAATATFGGDIPFSAFADLGIYLIDALTPTKDSVRMITSSKRILFGPDGSFTIQLFAQVDPTDTGIYALNDSLFVRVDTLVIRNAIDTGRITGAYAYYDRNGRKFMMTIGPSLNSEASHEGNLWYDLMISEESGYTPIRRLRRYIKRGSTPVWATYRNSVILAIEGQRAIKFDGRVARALTPRAPGQVEATPIPDKGIERTLHGKDFAGVDSSSIVPYGGNIDSLIVDTAAWNASGGSSFCCDSIIDDSAFFLDGTYRWAILLVDPEDTGTSRNKSYVTPEFGIDNGRAVIYDMFGEALDSMLVLTQGFDTTGTMGFSRLARVSSITFQLLRSRGRPAGLGPDRDTLFFVQEFTVGLDTLGNWRHVDSLPDDSLTTLDGGSDTAFILIPMDSSYLATYVPVADSTTDTTGLWYQTFNNVIGAPQLIRQMHNTDSIYFGSVNPASKDTVMWWSDVGFSGLPGAVSDSFYEIPATVPWVPEVLADKDDHRDSTWVATGYFVALIDSITGEESDSGVNLIVPHKISSTGQADDSVVTAIILGLPPGISADSSLQLKLYRYMIYYGFVTDTVVVVKDTIQIFITGGKTFGGEPIDNPQGDTTIRINNTNVRVLRGIKTVTQSKRLAFYELQRTIPYPVTTFTDQQQSIFVDTFTWRELWNADQIVRATVVDTTIRGALLLDTAFASLGVAPTGAPWIAPSPLPPISGVTVYADRLLPWNGSRLYTSVLDTFGLFRPFNTVAFNLDDGDAITWAEVSDNRIHVYKNFSYFILYDPVSGLPTKTAQVRGIGCVAPHSYQQLGGRAIYLSADGVIVEQTAEFKDYRVNTGLVSQSITDLLIGDRPMSQLKNARAVIWDNKYLLSIPETDTTFVYYLREKIPTWGIWTFSFYQGTGYDSLEVEGLVRSNEMIIALDTDERLFALGGSYVPFDIGRTTSTDSNAVGARLQTGPLFTDPSFWQIQQVGLNAYTGTKLVDISGFQKLGIVTISVLGNRNAFQDSVQYPYTTDNYKLKMFSAHSTQFPTLLIETGKSSADSLGIQSLHIWGRVTSGPIPTK